MRFYLGTHEERWLARERAGPLFVSRRRLVRRSYGRLRAASPWALDSGAFTELRDNGRWTVTPREYADDVERFAAEIGKLEWAAPCDWMVEPFMLTRTGLSLDEHLHRTVASVVELSELVESVPIVPVLQGWTLADYLRCVELYDDAGIDLTAEPLVGVGSVCRRQDSTEIAAIVGELAGLGIRLHGFGVKRDGFGMYARHLASADSLSWSFNARKNPPLAQCTHRSCSNCFEYALRWRDQTLARGEQLAFV